MKLRKTAILFLIFLCIALPGCRPASADTADNAPQKELASQTTPSLSVITQDTVVSLGVEQLYHFRPAGSVGCCLDGTVLPYELYYGISVETEGSSLIYRAYSHLENIQPVELILLMESRDRWAKVQAWAADNASGGWVALESSETGTIDTGDWADGLYTLAVRFSNHQICPLSFYVNRFTPYLLDTACVSQQTLQDCLTGPEQIREITACFGVTPENSLGVDSQTICYPCWQDPPQYRCDTELWQEMAHQIVPDDTLPDSIKLVMLHDWMTQQLAYDRYVADVLDKSRDRSYKVYDGTWSVYNTHAGVCRDFTNIFAILCRELGIPCSSLESQTKNHTWSIVYLEGQWHEVDLTYDIQRYVSGEDVTLVENANCTLCYDHFLPGKPLYDWSTVTSAGHGVYSETFVRTGQR